MKTIKILLGLCLMISSSVFGQNIRVLTVDNQDITGDTVTVVYHPDGPPCGFWTDVVAYMHVKNAGSTTLNILAKKADINLPAHVEHSFCLVQCYTSTTFVAPDTLPLAGDSIYNLFTSHYSFYDTVQPNYIGLVSLTAFDAFNHNDSAIVYIKFNTKAVFNGITENSKNDVSLSQAYPNPANGTVSLNYQLNANNKNVSFVVLNSVGECVKTQSLNDSKGTISFDTKEWASGVYYYSITGNNIETKQNKLVITH
jgi:hypothetical protein